jgi:O-acetyl-ADP-ribose deacetylase (regulator of RNase III)
MPRIGCGLAGGKWGEVEPIIVRALREVETYVYDFDTGDNRTVGWTP